MYVVQLVDAVSLCHPLALSLALSLRVSLSIFFLSFFLFLSAPFWGPRYGFSLLAGFDIVFVRAFFLNLFCILLFREIRRESGDTLISWVAGIDGGNCRDKREENSCEQ